MKKWMTFLCPFCLAASLTVPAFALDYNVAAPGDPEYAKACSMDFDILPPSDDRVFKLIMTSPDATPVLADATCIPPRVQRACADTTSWRTAIR